jgi:hypothetical protein
MRAWAFWQSQFRRGSWVRTEAKVVTCIPAGYHLGEYDEYQGDSYYLIQVRYPADTQEVLAEFRWHMPLIEGDMLPLRYDPANPECNNRTGIWIARQVLFLALVGLAFLISMRFA